MRRLAPPHRACFVSVVLCASMLAQSLAPVSAGTSTVRGAGNIATPAVRAGGGQRTEAERLPDLDEVRRRPSHEPKAVPPVPSKRRRCPPGDRNCNGAAPQVTPTPATLPAPKGHGDPHTVASVNASSLFELADAALNGAGPRFDLRLLDYYSTGGGYSVSDAPPFSPLAAVPPYAAPLAPRSGVNTASFAGADSSTQGRWRDSYGADGYGVAGDSASYPSYAQVSVSGQSTHTWASSTSDVRGLQKAAGSDRVAACWYSFTSFTIDVNLTDGQAHRVSVYALDWDGVYNRSQRVDVLDAATGQVLDTRTLSAFTGGRYLSWDLRGHTLIRFTHTGQVGSNAVAGGLFFDPAEGAAAAFLRADSATQGNWKGVYGADGYDLAGDAASLPPYAQASIAGQSLATWAATTPDARALQRASGQSGRLAACWYSFTNFTIDVNLTDGQAHQVALYLVDWDGNNSRAETIEVLNASTNSVLDSRGVSSFGGGRYMVWRLKGRVRLRVTLTGSPNAVASGLFFDSSVQTVGNGLTADYYDGDDFDAHRLTRTDAAVDFDWGAGSPAAGVSADLFSARWTGMVAPRHSETYTFYAYADDGVRLWVDGQLVIDKWVNQGPAEWAGQAALRAGRSYSIRMEYYERWGGARARLSWSSPSQAKEVVPQSCLYGCWKSAEQYARDFFQGALGRRPSPGESQDWAARLNQAQGEDQLVGQAQGLGVQTFASAEYAGRSRGDRDYVSDLYWAYTQRAPDASGWDYWAGQIAACGSNQSCRAQKRADVRSAFDQSAEFQEKVRRLCGTSAGAPDNGGVGYNFSTARLDPSNLTGRNGADAYSRNFNFRIPLLTLPGRAGLDLGLTLSYNSLVWTRDATGVTFDADEGSPSPGFRLGFPVIQPKFVNPRIQQAGQPARYSYLLVTPSGARVELRQAGASNVYESADSSHLQLTEEGGWLTLRPADGSQLGFALLNGSYRCHEVRDRHGNHISVAYWGDGRIDRVVDTLGRTINFSYDNYQNLISITQPWKRKTEANPAGVDEAHTWATFGYAELTLRPQFSDLAVMGEQPGSVVPVVDQVGLSDGSYYRFEYNGWGQVWKATRYAADAVGANGRPDFSHALTSTRVDLPGSDLRAASPQADCPRFTEEREWVEHGVMSQSAEVKTSYSAWAPDMASCEVTSPDGTKEVSHYATSAGGWRRGLTTSSEVRSGGQAVKATTLAWEHDGAADASHPTNPRVTETTVTDPQGNGRTTRVEYTTPADFQGESGYTGALDFRLPKKVEECTAGCAAVLRTTVTDYKVQNLGEYVSRRVFGLARYQKLYEGAESAANLRAQVGYVYDEPNDVHDSFLAGLPSQAAQHYGNEYGAGHRWRGNANRVRRYEVNQQTGAVGAYVESRVGFNVTGTLAYAKDPARHKSSVSYADAFYQDINRTHAEPQYRLQTFAYPTAVTNPDGFTSSTRYNYDMGVATKARTPKPNQTASTGQPEGPEVSSLYDAAGRLVRVTNDFDAGRTRWAYSASMKLVQSFTLLESGVETYAASALDGAGRVRAKASDLPGSVGGYAGQIFEYDSMGRLARQSNPAETNAAGDVWAATGDDSPAPPHNGTDWAYTQTTYDWNGRPLVVTNPGAPATTKEFIYDGCGCAGGEVVVVRDEVGRRRKVSYDTLGRVVKTQDLTIQNKSEPLSYAADESDVYRTASNTYNARGQVVEIQSHAGKAENDPTKIQKFIRGYDGHGRLSSSKDPAQDAPTGYIYNADDTLWKATDARGVTASFTYNNRHMVRGVVYAAPAGLANPSASNHVPASAPVDFDYDAAGNRLWMIDALGRVDYVYDTLSRMTSEKRTFGDPANTSVGGVQRTLSYGYSLAGRLKYIIDPAGSRIDYGYDEAGRLRGVTGSGTLYSGVTTYASGIKYRAWGAVKEMTYGNNFSMSVGYNARRLPQSFQVNKSPQAGGEPITLGQYSYYADGGLRSAEDGLDDRFDRAYSYDQVGRLHEAYSGYEARAFTGAPAGGAADRPYRQSYTFDVWDNMRGRSGAYWSEPDGFSADYDARGLNPVWLYDASGNVTNDGEAVYRYDAAGRLVERVSSFWNGTYNITSQSVTAYDGDGRVLKRNFDVNTYYLYSSVLGTAVTELDRFGAKKRTFVSAGGEVVASQWQASHSVEWIHSDPVTGGQKRFAHEGWATAEDEFDPTGVSVGRDDPFAEPDGGSVTAEPGFSGLTSANGQGGMRCTIWGMEYNCAGILAMAQAGALAPAPQRATTIPVIYQGQRTWAVWRVYQDGYQGYVPATAGHVGNGYFVSHVRNLAQLQPRNAVRDTAFAELNGVVGNSEALLGRTPDFMLQDITGSEKIALVQGVLGLYNRPKCKRFWEVIFKKLKSTHSQRAPVADDLPGVLDSIDSQEGFVLIGNPKAMHDNKLPGGGFFSTITGGQFYRNAQLLLNSKGVSATEAWMTVMHEAIHVAGYKFGYDDSEMAKAVFEMRKDAGLDMTGVRKLPDEKDFGANSRYWHTALSDACNPSLVSQ